jgi:hypothetical protein
MEEKGRSNKRISRLSMTSVLLIPAIVLTLLTVTPVMAQEAEVTVNAPEYVEEGQTFEATIDVEDIMDFNNGMFDLAFDHKVVKVEDVEDGSIDDTEIPVTLWAPMDSDMIKVMLELSGTTTVSGSGYLAKITFEVKGDEGEESTLELSNGELVKFVFEEERATPEAIEANWNSATVKVRVEAVEEEPTPAQTLAPGEIPTPTPEANVTKTPSPTSTLAPRETPTPTPTPTLAPEVTPKRKATPGVKTTPKAKATPATKGKSTPTPTPKSAVPGFNAIFVIAVMSAIAYILRRRK